PAASSGRALPCGVPALALFKGVHRATIEFTRDGKILVTVEEGGKKVRHEATYKVEGKGFKMTIKHGDTENTEAVQVVRVDDKELVLRGEKDGNELTLKRKGKKED